jgi:hypothetical protein
MKSRSIGSRLVLFGVLALTLTVLVGVLSGGVAEAKKKNKKGNKGSHITAVAQTPVAIPARTSPTRASLTDIPIVIGKKAKGKKVAQTIQVTMQGSGPADFLDDEDWELVDPEGRPVFLQAPFDDVTTAFGPLTWSPDSFAFICSAGAQVTPLPCFNPKLSILRPYVGTVSDVELALFYGALARGTWHLLIVNGSPVGWTVSLVSLSMDLEPAEFVD